jgi:hypothetical protein
MEMLFQQKHRGAISITAETFELFVKSLISSPAYKDVPMKLLKMALDSI